MPRVLVYNGWAAPPETWDLCTFPRERVFGYVEELDGVPERFLAETAGEVVLVGFSMGGSMALKSFLAFPDRVRALVLVSTTACMMERPEEGWKGMSLRRREALYLGTRMMHGDDPSPVYNDADLKRGLDYLQATDLRGELAAACAKGLTRLPVRIFQSERDGIVRPPNADFLRSVFPGATVTRIPGGEHTLPLTIPEKIDAAVAETLDAL